MRDGRGEEWGSRSQNQDPRWSRLDSWGHCYEAMSYQMQLFSVELWDGK